MVDIYHSKVVSAAQKLFPRPLSLSELATQVEKFINEHYLRENTYEEIVAIHHNSMFNVVPDALFSKDHIEDYLKYNTVLLPNDLIACDGIPELEIHTVYIPYTNVNNILIDNFGAFEYVHLTTVLLKAIQQDTLKDNQTAYLYFSMNTAVLAIFKDSQLLLINSFEIANEHDLTYYVLFALEQCSIRPGDLLLKVMGNIQEGDAYFNRLYTFIDRVECHESPLKWETESEIDHNVLTTLALT